MMTKNVTEWTIHISTSSQNHTCIPLNNVIKKQQMSFFSSVWVFQWIWFSPLSVLLHQSQWRLQRQWKYQRLAGWHQRDCLAGLLLLHQTVAAMICVATNQDWKSSAAASKDTVGQVPQVYLSSPTMQSSFWHKTIRNKLLLYKYIHCRLAVYKQGKPNRSQTQWISMNHLNSQFFDNNNKIRML